MSTIAAMKILLAADGSKHSIDAVKFLTSHIDWVRERPELELLYVHPPLPKLSGLGAVIGKKQLQQYYDEEGSEALTLEKIGALLGVTRERIRQIRERAFEKLRESPDVKSLKEGWVAA